MKKYFALILVAAMLLCSCAYAADSNDISALAGTYVLDATALGMPIQIYLTVDAEGNFQWTNKLVNGADKGHGLVGGQDGVYVMMYSDSTADSAKSATFTMDGVNLVFSTRVPYGTAGLNLNTEDPENIIYPVAMKMVYEDMLGTYVGSYVSESMMGTVEYSIELTLSRGAKFALESSFSAMGERVVYAVNGDFTVEEGNIVLTAADFEGVGTVTDGTIALSSRLSAQSASLKEYSLNKAVTAEVAGTYSGYKALSMMQITCNAELVLDKIGGYTYTAVVPDEETYTEQGTFTCENGVITLQNNADGAEPVIAALENEMLIAKMRIHSGVPMATEIVFYSDKVQGTFTASGAAENGVNYVSELTLNPDATYTIAVTADGIESYTEEGTFAIAAGMAGTSLILTDSTGFDTTGMVADTINVTHVVNESYETLGFKYTK